MRNLCAHQWTERRKVWRDVDSQEEGSCLEWSSLGSPVTGYRPPSATGAQQTKLPSATGAEQVLSALRMTHGRVTSNWRTERAVSVELESKSFLMSGYLYTALPYISQQSRSSAYTSRMMPFILVNMFDKRVNTCALQRSGSQLEGTRRMST